jgi:hypothetical protein
MEKWIDINDKLPEHNKLVLILTSEEGYRLAEYQPTYLYCWRGNSGVNYSTKEITHWMKLPDPPELK